MIIDIFLYHNYSFKLDPYNPKNGKNWIKDRELNVKSSGFQISAKSVLFR